ncbi:recombinase family protein [Candidatus Lokiarchaeum ossiferum]|uniref:recombinase family protein n=1 Tax=Candidatus Lokiarchaeum ossiferum TaxID=2951803 RepID=UPI00352F658C
MKLFAYLRNSTNKQAEKATEQAQLRAITEFVKEQGNLEVVEVFRDLAESGKSDENRPQFKEMLSRLSEVDGIIAFDMSRLTRDFEKGIEIAFILKRKKKYFANVKKNEIVKFESLEKILIYIIQAYANQIERESINKRQIAGIKNFIALNGKWGASKKEIDWELYEKYKKMKLPNTSIAKLLEINIKTLYKRLKERRVRNAKN